MRANYVAYNTTFLLVSRSSHRFYQMELSVGRNLHAHVCEYARARARASELICEDINERQSTRFFA